MYALLREIGCFLMKVSFATELCPQTVQYEDSV